MEMRLPKGSALTALVGSQASVTLPHYFLLGVFAVFHLMA